MEIAPIVNLSIWFVVKIMFLVGLAVYVIFSFVIIRQTKLMTDTLEVGFEIPIRLIAWGHLLFALGVFVLALIIL